MTERTWEDFDTHLMQRGTARNDYFHAVENCPRIKGPELTVDRPESYVAHHEPEPCSTCHPEVPAPDHVLQLVIIPSERADAHYHVDERCAGVGQMTDPKRVSRSETDAEPCTYCVGATDGDTIQVCPECDETMIRRLVESGGWTCRGQDCGATFDEPAERPRQGGNDGPVTGLARKLLEADPDDVSAENAGEPMTDGGRDLVKACPECDSVGLKRRSDVIVGTEPAAPYYCRHCSTAVQEPVERERHKSAPGRSGLAGKLEEMDPDDVSAENAGEPMTDGGQDVVLVSSSAGSRGNTTYHRDQSCGYVQRMDKAVEKPLDVLAGHYDPCSKCAVATDGGRPGGDGECPQGCRHPVAGRETMEYREEKQRVEPPEYTEVYGEVIEITERTNRYAECIVCGWGYSL